MSHRPTPNRQVIDFGNACQVSTIELQISAIEGQYNKIML